MRKAFLGFVFVFLGLLILSSCKWINPTAPSDSVLLVSANPTAIPAGGATSVITVIGYDAAGNPLKDRTIIYFAADMGTIDPSVEMKNGRAAAIFKSGPQSGEAHIQVTSGMAKVDPSVLKIIVGAKALKTLTIRANPVALPPGGGKSQIIADAFDESGNGLVNIPVIFTTDAGRLDSGGKTLYTDSLGSVEDCLTTSEDAKVKAISGGYTPPPEVTISVGKNEPPEAKFQYSPSAPKVNERVYFNASESYDPDGTIVSYEWDFGNGRTGSGVQTSFQYNADGTYNVTLVVRDNLGAADSQVQSITVAKNTAPTAKYVYSPAAPKVNESVYFNASQSDDPDGTIVSYEWDFGDGQKGTGIQTVHQFAAAKTYNVTLMVRDNLGATAAQTQLITVAASTLLSVSLSKPHILERSFRL